MEVNVRGWTLVLLCLPLVASACGGDSTGPAEPPAGMYRLISRGGQTLPIVVGQDESRGCTYWMKTGSLEFRDSGTVVEFVIWSEDCPGSDADQVERKDYTYRYDPPALRVQGQYGGESWYVEGDYIKRPTDPWEPYEDIWIWRKEPS